MAKFFLTVMTIWVLCILMTRADIASGDHSVQTYIIKVQEKRHSTRWTLTEWLRIKERMRLMDLWLAMFSNPKADEFRPELNLSYGILQGTSAIGSDNEYETFEHRSRSLKGQIWMTNILTASTGLKMVNIDFGLEGVRRETLTLSSQDENPSSLGASSLSPLQQHWLACFRLFGKHIQDSSLIIKVGQYDYPEHLAWDPDASQPLHGLLSGLELSVYLFKWLGIEGQYLKFGDEVSVNTDIVSGTYTDYLAYIEISLLRLTFGRYQEIWNIPDSDGISEVENLGIYSGIEFQI